MNNSNAKEIIRKYLIDNGYDGLAGDGCGCFVGELILCESDPSECIPAYLVKCVGCGSTFYDPNKNTVTVKCDGC